MIRFFTIAVAAVMMTFATNSFAQMQVGAGYLRGLDEISISSVTSDISSNGVYAGFSYNLPIVGGLGVAPGLYYSFMFSNDSYQNIADAHIREHFANVPVYLNYKFGLGANSSLFIYAGPTVQLGLVSTVKTSVLGLSGTIDRYKDNDYSRTNILVGGGIGLNLNKIQISLGYDQGLFNLDTSDDGTKWTKSYLKAGIAYLF